MLSHFIHIWPFATLWTRAHRASLSMGFSRQEYWSGLPCLPPGDLPDPGIEPSSLKSPALAGGLFTTSTTWEVWSLLKGSQICNRKALLAFSGFFHFLFHRKSFPSQLLVHLFWPWHLLLWGHVLLYFFPWNLITPGFWSILVTEWWHKEVYAI